MYVCDGVCVCVGCGVLCVHVHGGQDLKRLDATGLSDPYCIVMANKEKVRGVEFILVKHSD